MSKDNSKKNLRGPRCSAQKIIDENIVGYEGLAFGIVTQAVADARTIQAGKEFHNPCVPITTQSLINFFESRWCDMLLGTTDLTGHDLRKKVGI